MLFVLVVLSWVVKQADLTNLPGLISALVENAVQRQLSDGLSISNSFYSFTRRFIFFFSLSWLKLFLCRVDKFDRQRESER